MRIGDRDQRGVRTDRCPQWYRSGVWFRTGI